MHAASCQGVALTLLFRSAMSSVGCLDVCCGSDTDFKKGSTGPQMKCKCCGEQRSVVLACNAVAAALHAALFITLLFIVYAWDINLERPLSQKISVWENATAGGPLKDACFHSDECAIPSPKIFVKTTDGKFNIYDKEVNYGSLSLTWLVLSFSLLSAVFQGLRPFMDSFERCLRPCLQALCGGCCNFESAAARPPRGSAYLTQDVMRGVNSSRFVEYSASATVMIVAIAFILNVKSFETVVALATLTACCQLCGMVAELLLERSDDGYKTELFPAAWLLHGVGWLQMGATFWLVLLRFQQSASEANAGNGVAPPAFVYGIVYGQLAFFSTFGCVQFGDFVHRTCYDKPAAIGEPADGCCSERKCFGCPGRECVELSYISLSLSSKVVLSVLVAANLFLNPNGEA